MQRHVIAIALLALAITAALGVYALQPPAAGAEAPAAGEPATEVETPALDVGIQEAADQACRRLLSDPVDDFHIDCLDCWGGFCAEVDSGTGTVHITVTN